jgi:hypothetical protein
LITKQIKNYTEFINESKGFDQSRFPLEDPGEVKKWIQENLEGKKTPTRKHRLSGAWTIGEEGYVSCTGDINLSEMKLTKLPFRIKSVGGDFDCSNNKLTSLEGLESLKSVRDYFLCSKNQLTTLEGLKNLEFVGGSFRCDNNKLTGLKGLENLKSVGEDLWLHYNKLTSLEGFQSLKFVDGTFACHGNKLTSLKGLENLKSVGGDFRCHRNNILSKKFTFEVKGNIEVEPQEKYEDSIKYLVSLPEEEQKKIIEDLMDWDLPSCRKLLSYSEENNIKLSINQEVYKWNKEAKDLEDTGLEF